MTRFDELSAALHRRDVSASQTLDAQTSARLTALLAHHWRGNNPAWQQCVASHGLSEAQLPRSAGELGRLPLMTRDLLRAGGFAERPNAAAFQCVSTSGSTQSAVRMAHNFEMSRATLFDNFLRLFVLNGIADPFPFYGISHRFEGSVSGSQTTMRFMSEHFGDAVAVGGVDEPHALHHERLTRLAPRTLASAPGVVTALASHVLEQRVRLAIPLIVVGGAPLHVSDRALIERAFSPQEILIFYPTTDAGALGGFVNLRGEYVSFPETHVIEVVHADGMQVAAGEEGLVAVTALDSLATPLIRYLVGDRVTYLGRGEGDSGRGDRVRMRAIRRTSDAMIGDFKIPLADLEGWRDALAQRGFHTSALQVAKRRTENGQLTLLVRIEASAPPADAQARALEVVLTDKQITYGIQRGILGAPRIELFSPGTLLQGRFKMPIFVDESELP